MKLLSSFFAFLPILAICVSSPLSVSADEPESMTVYIGTYTSKDGSQGIYRSSLSLKTGALSEPELAAEMKSPSFLAIHPTRPMLYAVSEVGGDPGEAKALHAFAINPKTGELSHLNNRTTGGGGACHVTVAPSGTVVLVANYGGGSVTSVPINEDGSLGEPASFIQHEGSSVNPRRQKGPHAHSINASPDSRFVYAADLGLDKVLIYKLDSKSGSMTANKGGEFAKVDPGAGPRHFAMTADGEFAYVINELTSSVTAFRRDIGTGALTTLQTLTTLPKDFDGNNSTAEVLVHPNGKFLFGSNRGHDSIASFAIEKGGKLSVIGHTPIGGKTPRGFSIDPTGAYLIACGQNSGTVHVFKIDQESGELESIGDPIKVSKPVCVKFATAGE